ncbi:MAG: hypothetical protein AAF387_10630, partial [Pseudomonadota bacterium]
NANKERTATAFALWSMATKLALAAAILIGFVSLGQSGAGENFDQVESGRLLMLLYVAIPIGIKLLVFFVLRKFLMLSPQALTQ